MKDSHIPNSSVRKTNIDILVVSSLLFAVLALCCGCSTAQGNRPPEQSQAGMKSMEETWGIRVKSLRLSAGGNLVDLRYQVTNVEKASGLLNNKDVKPYIIDRTTGAVLSIPDVAKVGALRSSPKDLLVGKIYFMMFANPGLVKRESKATVVIGDFKAENLTVE